MPEFESEFSDELAALCERLDASSVSGSERSDSGGRSSCFKSMMESRSGASSAPAMLKAIADDELDADVRAATMTAVDASAGIDMAEAIFAVDTSGAIDMAAADEISLSPRYGFFAGESDTDELKGYMSGAKRPCRNGELEDEDPNTRGGKKLKAPLAI